MSKKPGHFEHREKKDTEKILEDLQKGPFPVRDAGPIGMTEEQREQQARKAEEEYARMEQKNAAWVAQQQQKREQAEEDYRLNHRTGEYFGKITSTTGRVYIRSKDDGEWHIAKPGQIVLNSDVLRTDDGSSILLNTNGGAIKMGSRTVLKPGSEPVHQPNSVPTDLG